MPCTSSSNIPFLATSSCLLASTSTLHAFCLSQISYPSAFPTPCPVTLGCRPITSVTPGTMASIVLLSHLSLEPIWQSSLGGGFLFPRNPAGESHVTNRIGTRDLTGLYIPVVTLLSERLFQIVPLSKLYLYSFPPQATLP